MNALEQHIFFFSMKKRKPKKKKGNRKTTLWLIPIIIIGIAALGFYPLSSTHFVKRAKKLLKHAAIDSCTMDKVSLTLYSGVIIKNLHIHERVDAKKTVHAHLPEVKIDYRFFKVVPRWKKSKAALKNRFLAKANKSKSRGKGNSTALPTLYNNTIKPSLLLLSCIKTVSLKGAAFHVDSLGTKVLEVSGLDCRVKVNQADSSRMKIKLSADTFQNTQVKVLQMRSKVSIDSSLCTVDRITGKVFNGTMKGALTLDLPKNRIVSGNIGLKDIYLEKMYRSRRDETGTMSGRCNFSMVLDPGVADLGALEGRGTFAMRDVSMNELPALKKFVRLTDLTSLFHLTFKKLQGDFVIKDGKVTSDTITGEGKPISVNASGWFKQEKGKYNYKVKGLFDAEYKDSIPRIVWNALVPEEKGRRSFFCTVYGDEKSLSVSLEKRVMRRAINNAFEEFGKEMEGLFKR